MHPRACQLLQDSKIFLVGLSGDSVSDDLLVVSLLKGVGLGFIEEANAAATHQTQTVTNPVNSTFI